MATAKIPYGVVVRRTWQRPNFRKLSDQEKLLLVYLWSEPEATSAPIFRCSPGSISDNLGWSREAVIDIIKQLENKGWVRYDEEALVMFLPKQISFNPPANGNVVKSFLSWSEDIPDSPLLLEFFSQIAVFAEKFGVSDTLHQNQRNRFGYPVKKNEEGIPNQEQDQEQDQEQEQEQDQEQGGCGGDENFSVLKNQKHPRSDPDVLKAHEFLQYQSGDWNCLLRNGRAWHWVAGLIHDFGVEKVISTAERIRKFYEDQGIPPPGELARAREKFRAWCERPEVPGRESLEEGNQRFLDELEAQGKITSGKET